MTSTTAAAPDGVRPAPPAAVLFDLDGVIIDSWQATLLALAAVVTAQLGQVVAATAFEPFVTEPPPDVFEAFGVPSARQVYDDEYDPAFLAALPAVAVFEPVVAGIRELAAAGVGVGVVTRQSERRAHLLIPPELADCALVLIAHEQAEPKPAPDGLLLALDRLGVPPGRALFVGDTRTDVVAARAAGVRCVLVEWGFTPAAELAGYGADAVLTAPSAIGVGLLRLLDGESLTVVHG